MADVIMERNCVESAQIVGQPHVESTSTCQSNLMLQIQNRSLIMETFYQQMEQSVTNLENFMKEDDKEVEAVFKDVTELFKKEKDPIITNELTMFITDGHFACYQIQEIPKHNWIDGFLCFLLGVTQIIGGVLLCTFSAGLLSESNFCFCFDYQSSPLLLLF